MLCLSSFYLSVPTTHYSLLTTHYPLPTTHYLLLTIHYPTTNYSLPTTYYPLLSTYYHYPLLTIDYTTHLLRNYSSFYFPLSATPENCQTVGRNDLILLDSGGQYIDGTTDVTRTFHTGTPTDFQKEMFTRVLKGNIGIDSRVFIAGTVGAQLDSYAREHLWIVGKDYIHGMLIANKEFMICDTDV